MASVKGRYDNFFNERDIEKRRLYDGVIYYSIVLIACSVPTGLCGIMIWYSYFSFLVTTIGQILGVLGTFMCTLGITLISTVPRDEFNIEVFLASRQNLRYYMEIVIFVILCFLCTIGLLMLPFVTGFPLFGIAMWIMRPMYVLQWLSLTAKIGLSGTATYLIVIVLHMDLALCPEVMWRLCPLRVIWSSNSTDAWVAAIASQPEVCIPLYLSMSIVFIIAVVNCCNRFKYLSASCSHGWETTFFFYVLYSWLFATGITSLQFTVVAHIFGRGLIYHATIVPMILVTVTVLAPPLAVIVLGESFCFTALARYFEYQHERLLSDGALLAELVSSSVHISEGGNYWKMRKQPVKSVFSKSGAIDSNIWVKGCATETGGGCIVVHFSKPTDSASTASFFKGNELVVSEVPQFREETATIQSWAYLNFVEDELCMFRDENACTLKVNLTRQKSSTELLDIAKANLRCLYWSDFNDELLLKSPRDLNSSDKVSVFELSKQTNCKIDFFVSHSWSDCPVEKCKLLRSFCKNLTSKYGEELTLWLDKVCINQLSMGESLAVLPINIAFSKKILIILSRSYMTRLWCVWELFCVVAFCHKELAVDRIKILYYSELTKADVTCMLLEFDIDKAHCFDPNEELKLRNLIFDIGLDRLKLCLKALALQLEGTAVTMYHPAAVVPNDSVC
jgi:hypothetical protein